MLNLEYIKSNYPPILHSREKDILREYLQYKILDYIFSCPESKKLCFIGWTALRIGYGNIRFSEDLDFDNQWLTQSEFEKITRVIQKKLEQEWYIVEIRHIYKWAFHCIIKIPKILFDNNLASMETEKLVIKIDTVAQWFIYPIKKLLLQKFEVSTIINIADLPQLLSYKINALLGRYKGRDIFDIIFILANNKKPDWTILKKIGINHPKMLKSMILERIKWISLSTMQDDVKYFIFDSNDTRVLYFKETIQQTEFEQ